MRFSKSHRLVGYYFQSIVEDFRSEWRPFDQFYVISFLNGQPFQQEQRRRLESQKEPDFDSLTSFVEQKENFIKYFNFKKQKSYLLKAIGVLLLAIN